MQDQIQKISDAVEALAAKIVMMDGESTSSELEDILAGFNKVSSIAGDEKIEIIESISRAAAGVTAGVMVGSEAGGMSLENIANAISCLQEMLRVIDDESALGSVKIPDILKEMINGNAPPKEEGNFIDLDEDAPPKKKKKATKKKIAAGKSKVKKQKAASPPPEKEDIASEEDDAKAVREGDADLLTDFIAESNDHLEQAEKSMLSLEENPDDDEEINAIFRAFHTIKGVAGFLGTTRIQNLAHHAETLLDKVRKNEVTLAGSRIDIIFDSIDGLKILIADIQEVLKGDDPKGFKGYENLLGRLEGSACEEDETIPVVTSETKLGEILLEEGSASREEIDAALEIQEIQESQEDDKSPLGEILIEQGTVQPRDVGKALRGQANARKGNSSNDEGTVRVGTGRLDNLIDMVGELVIAQAMVSQDRAIMDLQNQRIERNMSHLGKITRDLQELSMAMRMVPINSTFQKMARLVRDLAKKGNKKIKFVMSGEETELDRNLVEVLHDPLVHMVRNAADHGVEIPEKRIAAGKPEEGQIHLKAYHLGGHIVVEIKDDGNGLDTAALLAKGREKGIVAPDQELSEEDIYNLVFHPGLSTAKEVTDVSGRGVGMDVVKKNIEKLRGKAEIASEAGVGSTFTISLPLTLAIIDGMIIRIGEQRMIIPLGSIVESFQPSHEQINLVQGRGEMINMRDRLLHLARFNKFYNIIPDTNDPTEAITIVVSEGNRECGLMVDEILGQQQVVIKSLGETMQGIPGIAGGTILGDGKVALILDVSSLIDLTTDGVTVVH